MEKHSCGNCKYCQLSIVNGKGVQFICNLNYEIVNIQKLHFCDMFHITQVSTKKGDHV